MGNILEITETRPTVQVTEAGNTLQVVAPNSIVITDVTPTVTITSPRPQVIVANAGIQGPIGLNWRNAWSVSNSYLKSDAVHYGGSCYYCVADVDAFPPLTPSTDTTHWNLLVSNGATGINWRGAWTILASYAILDAVEYLGSAFICTEAISGNFPPPDDFSSNTNWDLIVATAFVHKGDYDSGTRYDLNETVLKNGQMWRSLADGNATTPPDHPYENTGYWQYVTTAWLNQGTYDGGTTYYRGEVVDHLGSSYLCIAQTNLDHDPPDAEWSLVASKGDQGIQGTQGIVWTGEWSGITTYQVDEAVYFPEVVGLEAFRGAYICIQVHLATTHPPGSTGWEDYWDILVLKGAQGDASTVPGPAGGAVGTGYTFDLYDYSGGSNADGNCRFNVSALNLTLATKCWLSNKDNDGNDLSEYILSFEDSTSPVKCNLNVSKFSDSAKFLNFTVSSITSNAGGWKELTLIEPTSYSSVIPFGVDEILNISMNRTGDRGTEWEGDWSSSTAYLLSDAVMHNGSTWVCIQEGTDQEPVDGSSYWDMMASGGESTGSGVVGSGYLFDTGTANTPSSAEIRFDNTSSGSATFVHIHEVDISGSNNEKLFTEWLGGTDSSVKGYIKITSANDNERWWGAEITSLAIPSGTVHSLGIQNITSTLESSSTFTDEEKVIISLSRTGDQGVNWREEYSNSVSYELDDAVMHQSKAYVCTIAHGAGVQEPSEEASNSYWSIFARGFQWRALWNVGLYYYINDIVSYGGSSYICKTNGATGGSGPDVTPLSWDLFVQKSADGADGTDGTSIDMPIGSIIMWAGPNEPATTADGSIWKLCNGDVIGEVGGTYSALFAIIGTTYGGGGASDFKLPDFRGKFAAGYMPEGVGDDAWSKNLGDDGGESTVGLNKTQMPAHTHSVLVDWEVADGQVCNISGGGPFAVWQRFFENYEVGNTDMYMDSQVCEEVDYETTYQTNHPNATENPSPNYLGDAGGATKHENKPPFLIVNYIIKVL